MKLTLLKVFYSARENNKTAEERGVPVLSTASAPTSLQGTNYAGPLGMAFPYSRLLATGMSFLAPCGIAQAAVLSFTATLSGPNENPANNSPGIGTASAVYDANAHTLALEATFSGLTGTTTAAHIHAATTIPGGTAGVATTTPSFAGFPLGVTSGTFSNVLNLTLASSWNPAYVTAHGGSLAQAEADLIQAIIGGQAYFNIHTSAFGGGEIRGFFVPSTGTGVPDTGTTAAMLGLALASLAAFRRKVSI
jgi:hypothetical protein